MLCLQRDAQVEIFAQHTQFVARGPAGPNSWNNAIVAGVYGTCLLSKRFSLISRFGPIASQIVKETLANTQRALAEFERTFSSTYAKPTTCLARKGHAQAAAAATLCITRYK